MVNQSKLFSGILALALMAGMLPLASAQSGAMNGGMGCNGERAEQRAEMRKQRTSRLHEALKLTQEQESAWVIYAESMKEPACPTSPPEGAASTAPERAERMLERAKQHVERMSAHVQAIKRFYAVLTPEQKKTFDAHHAGPRGERRAASTEAAAPAVK